MTLRFESALHPLGTVPGWRRARARSSSPDRPTSRGAQPQQASAVAWRPRVDIIETAGQYEIQLEVPGVKADEINVQCHEQLLTIHGEKTRQRASDEEDAKERYAKRERQFGPFRRSFQLPAHVDEDRIRAKCANGVLCVTVPKMQERQSTSIPIQS